jgi:hypothetical protein
MNTEPTRQDLVSRAELVRYFLQNFEDSTACGTYWLEQATQALQELTKLSDRYHSLEWYKEYSK